MNARMRENNLVYTTQILIFFVQGFLIFLFRYLLRALLSVISLLFYCNNELQRSTATIYDATAAVWPATI